MSRFRRCFRQSILPALLCLLVMPLAFAQQKSKVELSPGETVFTVLTALNACDYNDDLANSDPVRNEVRAGVSRAVEQSAEASTAKDQMCAFYHDHRSNDSSRDLSQYVSLALSLGDAPDFKPRIKEADLPPDAAYVLGFVPLVAQFYKSVHLHSIWTSVQPRYEAINEKLHDPLANMILATDVYLKMPISGYVGRQFVVIVEPMAGPGQVNARTYGDDYYLVTAPVDGNLPMEQVRHTYLHFVLDPLSQKRASTMKRLEPILALVQKAPLDEVYKRDVALLMTESLIRAIEARTIPGKNAEAKRQEKVTHDMAEGFVLTKFFYDSLVKFEAEPTGLKDAFPDWLYYLDVDHERKRDAEIVFAARADSEVLKRKSSQASRAPMAPLDVAEQKISEGDLAGAEKLAQQVAGTNGSESPRAYLLLGEIATLNRDKDNAVRYFEQALQTAKEPRLIAWSHIYLGRIYDVDQERDMAVRHYQAALRAGDDTPQLKAAAERGLKSPYERKGSSEEDKK